MNKIVVGDVRDKLAEIDPGTVQTCVTSPPYWSLRDYGVEGQIGLEPTPEAFLETMVSVFRGVRRVLRDDGTVWLNIGDSYTGATGKQDTQYRGVGLPTKSGSNLKPKDLCLIPFRLALALQADGWYVRSDIIWAKGASFCDTWAGSVMPESVTDRPTTSHEHVFLLTKSPRYYYDAEAVREVARHPEGPWSSKSIQKVDRSRNDAASVQRIGASPTRNLRTVWAINPQPFSEAHFATYPMALVEPCIKAGSRVGDLVLDPFLGSGTTAIVAKRLGRRYVGIELNEDYARMAAEQIEGPLFAGV